MYTALPPWKTGTKKFYKFTEGCGCLSTPWYTIQAEGARRVVPIIPLNLELGAQVVVVL